MKSLINILLLTGVSLGIQAQDYIPLVKQNNTWVIYHWDDGFENYYALRIEGDTIINGEEYSKVYYYEIEKPQAGMPIAFTEKKLGGVIQEDISTQTVKGQRYLYSTTVFSEFCDPDFLELKEQTPILYFDLNIGQQFSTCQVDPEDLEQKIIKDTVEYIFGVERRVLINEHGLKLIEGVGYDDGLFVEAHSWIHAGWGFGLYDFCNDSINSELCNMVSSAVSIPNPLQFKIYPNPSTDLLHIKTDVHFAGIRIFNTYGNFIGLEVKETIDISEFKTGIYYLQLLDKNQTIIKTASFVKH